METELILEGGGFPPMSARGCHQTLTLVPNGSFRRTVNGDLCFVGAGRGKYRSSIRCEDKVTLVTEGVLSRGQVIKVGCIQRLWQQCGAGEICVKTERQVVSGSVSVIDSLQNHVEFTMNEDGFICFEKTPPDVTLYVSYRPWLLMRVLDLKLYTDEWGLKSGWSIDFEEV